MKKSVFNNCKLKTLKKILVVTIIRYAVVLSFFYKAYLDWWVFEIYLTLLHQIKYTLCSVLSTQCFRHVSRTGFAIFSKLVHKNMDIIAYAKSHTQTRIYAAI